MRRRKRCARFDIDKRLRGSCLHVWRHAPSTAGWPEEDLAHLCGYGLRPPLTQERFSIRDGKLAYRMKRRLGDGHDLYDGGLTEHGLARIPSASRVVRRSREPRLHRLGGAAHCNADEKRPMPAIDVVRVI